MIRSASACSRDMHSRVMTRGSVPVGHLFRRFLSSPKTAAAADDGVGWTYDHDVLVVGGGIVGCTLACRLAQQGVAVSTKAAQKVGASREGTDGDDTQQNHRRPRPSVRLVEARPPSPSVGDVKLDPRVYALAPASVRVFQSLGVWEGGEGETGQGRLLPGAQSQAFRDMQVWDDRGPGFLRFDGETPGEPLGFISEHGILHSSLFEKVKEFEADGSLELTCPAQVKRVGFPAVGKGGSRGPMTVTLETATGETTDVTCRLLVAADGGNSKVAKMLGLSSWGWGYGQRAVVATVRLADSQGTETAFQRYLARGPLAVLPLQDGMASLVWSTTPEHAELLKTMTEKEFLHEVNDALRRPPAVHGVETSTVSSASSAGNSPKFPPFSDLLSAIGRGSAGVGGVSGSAGLSKVIGGVSALAAPPVAMANAIAEGFLKEAEGVAWALAGLSLGLEAHGGFSTPPEAVEVMTPRLGFDLSLRQANAYVGERAALAGDAAHTVRGDSGGKKQMAALT